SRRRHTRSDRDWSQTCALPILLETFIPLRRTASGIRGCHRSLVIQPEKLPASNPPLKKLAPTTVSVVVGLPTLTAPALTITLYRSEERRVGKDRRSRSWPSVVW